MFILYVRYLSQKKEEAPSQWFLHLHIKMVITRVFVRNLWISNKHSCILPKGACFRNFWFFFFCVALLHTIWCYLKHCNIVTFRVGILQLTNITSDAIWNEACQFRCLISKKQLHCRWTWGKRLCLAVYTASLQ